VGRSYNRPLTWDGVEAAAEDLVHCCRATAPLPPTEVSVTHPEQRAFHWNSLREVLNGTSIQS